MKAVILT